MGKKNAFRAYWDKLDEGQQETLCRRLGTHRNYMLQIYSCRRKAGPKILVRIHFATGGHLTPADMRPDIPIRVPRKKAK